MERTPLDPDALRAALAGLPDWRPGPGALQTAYRCASAADALALVAAVGTLAEDLDHHPDVDWRHRLVFVRSTTHSAGGRVTAYDVELARRTTAAARDLSAEPVPALARTVEVAVDTADEDAVRPVWAAALGYRSRADGALADPYGRGPAVWFQRTATPDPSRLHLDVLVAAEEAAGVVAEVVRAGATADGTYAPAFTVVTDAQGNRLCVCSPEGRDDPTT